VSSATSTSPAPVVALLLRWTSVDRVAALLVVVQVLWRSWAGFRSYYWQDDFIYLWQASHQPLTSAYLMQDYHGHLMPAQFLLVWLLTRLAPREHAMSVLVVLLIQVAASVLMWLLARRLFGARWAALVPLAVYLFSPLTLTSFLWWAAALQALPLQLAMIMACWAHVRHIETGRRAHAIGALGALVVGLAFWQKALLIVPVLLALTLFLAPGHRPRQLLAAIRRRLGIWVAYVAVTAGYVALYLLHTSPDAGSFTWRAVPELAKHSIVSTFLPGILGGPWVASAASGTLASPPPPAVTWICVQLVVLVIGLSVWRRRGVALAAWSMLVGYLVLDVLLVAVSRLDFIGPIIGRDPRYTADAVVVAALCLGLAFVPVRGVATESPAARSAPFRLPRHVHAPAAVLVLLVIYANSAWITTTAQADAMRRDEARDWVRATERTVRDRPGQVIFDGPVPEYVIASFFGDEARVSRALAAAPVNPLFDRPTDDLHMIDGLGAARPVDMRAAASATTGPVPNCGWAARGTAPIDVPLDRAVPAGRWVVRIGYYTATATPIVVTVGVSGQRATLASGLHYLYVVSEEPQSVTGVTVALGEASATVCVTDVVMGVPWPRQEP
jgi:hypothetical protein